jgi:hypothetical protein
MNQNPQVVAMARGNRNIWDPLYLRSLSLTRSGLLVFHARAVAQSIVSLDLSHNSYVTSTCYVPPARVLM